MWSRLRVSAKGADASLHDIARRAGVGLATLYRHFPTRETLLEALLRSTLDELGISNALPEQVQDARTMTEIVCVQNMYNFAHRGDGGLIDDLADAGIAYVPFFRWEDSIRCNPKRWMMSHARSMPLPCRLRSPSCCSARPTSC